MTEPVFGVMKMEFSGPVGTPNLSVRVSMLPEVFTELEELDAYLAACPLGDSVTYKVVSLVVQSTCLMQIKGG